MVDVMNSMGIMGSDDFTAIMVATYPELYKIMFTTPSGLYSNDKVMLFMHKNKLQNNISFQQLLEYLADKEDMHEWWML